LEDTNFKRFTDIWQDINVSLYLMTNITLFSNVGNCST